MYSSFHINWHLISKAVEALSLRYVRTFCRHVVVEHGVLAAGRNVRQVQAEAVVASEPQLQLFAVVQFQHGSGAPHQGEDVETLQVLSR